MRLPFRKTPKRTGAHMVEFAFVIPVFLIFLFGLIEIGRAMMVSSLTTNAARTGARVAVVSGKSTSDVSAAVNTMMSGQGLSGHTTTVMVNGVVANASTAQTGDMVTVTVSISAADSSWVPGLSYLSNNITGQFSLPRE